MRVAIFNLTLNATARAKLRQMPLSEAQGCDLEAKVQGGGIQNLGRVHGHWDDVTAVVSG